MHLSTLDEWLEWIKSVHGTEIELGLERIKQVASILGVLTPSCATIIVGGTNGKGSTVAALESIYRAAGYRVACFTSPYLFRFNEQIRINGIEATDEALCAAFSAVNVARGQVSLTPFEFHTLAALWLMHLVTLDVMILEVGLGGRLDAVNIINADVAIVTSIAIDHVDFLGATREKIAFEKAGIFRKECIAICGDTLPPPTLIDYAHQCGARFFCLGQDFYCDEQANTWQFTVPEKKITLEPLVNTHFVKSNVSCALMAISCLQARLPVSVVLINAGINAMHLRGRIEVLAGTITQIFDVAHNPAAIQLLANTLATMPCQGRTRAVFSMLADKDILASVQGIKTQIADWYVAPLAVKRAASVDKLHEVMLDAGVSARWFADVGEAYCMAMRDSALGDRVLVFGSFHTVAVGLSAFK